MAQPTRGRNSQAKNHLITIVLALIIAGLATWFGYGRDHAAADPSATAAPGVTATAMPGDGLTVTYLDVGQGDCTLLQCDGQVMLIDAAEGNQANKITAYLKQHGVTVIDYLVCTHGPQRHDRLPLRRREPHLHHRERRLIPLRRTLSPAGAFWLAAFTYFIWGFTFLASRIAQDYGTPFVLLFWRFALAFALLNLLRLTGRFPVRFRARRLWPVLLAGLFEPVLYFPCEQYGLRLTSTSFSGVMVALIPLCSLVYGAVFLHEKATRRQVVFSVLSVAGVIVLAVYATGIGAGSFPGFLVLLGTVFAGAGYMVACRACSGSFTAFERTYITWGVQRFAAPAVPDTAESAEPLPPS